MKTWMRLSLSLFLMLSVAAVCTATTPPVKVKVDFYGTLNITELPVRPFSFTLNNVKAQGMTYDESGVGDADDPNDYTIETEDIPTEAQSVSLDLGTVYTATVDDGGGAYPGTNPRLTVENTCYKITHPNGPLSVKVELKHDSSGSGSGGLSSVDFSMDLGGDDTDLALGTLNLSLTTLNAAAYTPAALTSNLVSAQAQAILVSGAIRQVKTPSGLVDVVTTSSSSYEVRFYSADAVGALTTLYAINSGAVPYAVYKMSNATVGGGAPQLKIVESHTGATDKYYLYTQNTDGSWVLVKGTVGTGSTLVPQHRTTLVYGTANSQPVKIWTEEDFTSPTLTVTSKRTVYTADAAAPYTNQVLSTDSAGGRRETFDYALGTYNTGTNTFTASSSGTYVQTTQTEGVAVDASPLVAYRSTRTISVADASGLVWLENFQIYDGSAFQQVNFTTHNYDSHGNLLLTIKDGRTTYSAVWSGLSKQSETDETGVTTSYVYGYTGDYAPPALSSTPPYIVTKAGLNAVGGFAAQSAITTYPYSENNLVETYTVGADGTSRDTYQYLDSEGRVYSSTEHGLTTSTDYSTDASGNTVATATLPNGGTQITTIDTQGRIMSIIGTAVTPEYHTYGDNTDGTHWERVDYDATTSANYLLTTTDSLSRTIRQEHPAFGSGTFVHTWHYNTKGQLDVEAQTGQANRLYVYDGFGELYQTGLDLDGNGTLDPASGDHIQQTDTAYSLVSGVWYNVTTQSVYHTTGSGTPTAVSTTKQRLTLPTTMMAQTVSIDVAGGQTTDTLTVDRANSVVTETMTVPGLSNPAIRITRNGLTQSEQTPYQTQPTTFAYDGIGRLQTTTDPRAGTVTTLAYTVDDQPQSTIMSTATDSLVSSVVYFDSNGAFYDPNWNYISYGIGNAGQVATRTENGHTTNYTYDLRGNVLRTWGDTYPVQYEYDDFGRMAKLHTYRATFDPTQSTWPTGDVTTWAYDAATGLLLSKTDAATHGPTYTYWPSGNLKTRTWARTVGGSPLVTNYGYYDTATGLLQTITYSDSTPSVTLSYTRDGQPNTQTDAAGARTFTYDTALRPSGETYSTGELAGLSIASPVDAAYRESSLTVSNGATSLLTVGYSYKSDTGLLDTVTQGTYSVAHGFSSQSNYLKTWTHKVGGTSTLVTTRTPDDFGRVGSIASQLSSASSPFASYAYHYDSYNQRDVVTLPDSSVWNYGYDSLGQVQSGSHALASTQAVPGQAFGYTYDGIGNRLTATTNGRSATYVPDLLNRYTQRDVPGILDVSGSAATDARVAVNNTLATRTADRFYAAVPTSNSAAPVYPLVDVVAVHQQSGADVYARLNTGHLFLAKTPEVFSYDNDGNLTQDGRWNYVWDAENRLISMQTRSDVASALTALPQQKLDFVYDGSGRRIVKKVSSWNGSAWVLGSYHRFVYDSWNLAAELDAQASNATIGTYVWGLDLSGTHQGAGGVGGLLLATVGGATYAPSYDGNGDIVAWANLASGGSVAGQREYGPFGEALRVSGAAASLPFGFSSKYTDKETGLTYYGLRYYTTNAGRWLSHDPIEENGGLNLSGFVSNNPLGAYDRLGLQTIEIWASAYIPHATFIFPYPTKLDPAAKWYGDSRITAISGGSARAYHKVKIETDPSKSPSISNTSGGGTTKVDYTPGIISIWGVRVFTDTANDDAPPVATIKRSTDNTQTTVTMSAATSDPLVPGAPSLFYQYTFVFDTCSGEVSVTGSTKRFPSYDIMLNGVAIQNLSPQPAYDSPAALVLPPIPITKLSQGIQKY